MAFNDDKKKFLQAVNFQPDEIAGIEEWMANKAKQANGEGLLNKEAGQPAAAIPTTMPQQPQQQPVDNVDAKLKEAQEFVFKALEPILTPLTARISNLESALVAMQQQPVNNLTPGASLAAQSITQQPGAALLKGRAEDKGPAENNSDKEANQQAALGGSTGIQFLDNLLWLNQQQKTQAGG